MSAPATQVYANDRSGNLWILDPSTLTGPSHTFAAGAANAALVFDNTNTYNVFLPGIFNGATVQMGVYSAQNQAEVSGSPVAMPSGSFRPLQAAYDSTNNLVYVADSALGLTVWSTSTLAQVGSTLSPGAGATKAQGVAYDSLANRLYTCCQDGEGQDYLAVYNAATRAQVSGSPFALANANLSGSYTSIAFDPAHNRVLISANNGAAGLVALDASSATYAPVSGSPFATGGSDCRGLAVANGNVYVCNFGSNSLGVLNAATLAPAAGSPAVAGPSPASVACSASQIYVANFNGAQGGVTVLNASTLNPVTGSPFMPGVQLVGIAVGP